MVVDNIVKSSIKRVVNGVEGLAKGMHDGESRISMDGIDAVRQSLEMSKRGGVVEDAWIVEILEEGNEDNG